MPKGPKPLHPAILAASGFLYTDAHLTEKDRDAIGRLAQLVADPEEARRYASWPARYAVLGLTKDQGSLYRRTPAYLAALRDAIKLAALEGTGQATGTMIEIAKDPDHPQVVAAYNVLGKVGGVAQDKSVNINQTNNTVNVSLEGQLKALAEGRVARLAPVAKVVDAEVVKDGE